MTRFDINIKQVFPDAAEGDVCARFDVVVEIDGVTRALADVAAIVAAFRQDLEPDCFPESTPVFPTDVFFLPVTATDIDADDSMRELLCDATWTALMQWSGATKTDPAQGLPFSVMVEYPE
jgi:hypothetical protein